ncbi:MAG: sodium/proton antiporter, family [Mycobacterium sp.]|nr:sodium/proton antiporter, family [Mycobacterium sp.]
MAFDGDNRRVELIDGLDPRVLAEIRNTIARHSQDADEMPDPATHTLRTEVFGSLYPTC